MSVCVTVTDPTVNVTVDERVAIVESIVLKPVVDVSWNTVVVLYEVLVLVVVSDWLVPVMAVPVCVYDVVLLDTEEVVL